MSKEIYLEYRYSEIQNKLVNRSLKIAIIGLGYVGLPLAIAFSKKFQVLVQEALIQKLIELSNSMHNMIQI